MRTCNVAGHASLAILLKRRAYKIIINFNFLKLNSFFHFTLFVSLIIYSIVLNVYSLTVKISIFDNGDSGEPYVSSHFNTRCAVRDAKRNYFIYCKLIKRYNYTNYLPVARAIVPMGSNRSTVGVVIKGCELVGGSPVCCPFSVLMICDDIEELSAGELELSLFVTVITWQGEVGDVAVIVICSTGFCLPKCLFKGSTLLIDPAIFTSALSFSFSFSFSFSVSISFSFSVSFSFSFSLFFSVSLSFIFGNSDLKV